MIDFGIFTYYDQSKIDQHPFQHDPATCIRNEQGQDFYELRRFVLPKYEGGVWLSVHPDGWIGKATHDPQNLFPSGMRLVRLDQVEQPIETLMGMILRPNGTIVPPETPTFVVTEVTAAQAKIALHKMNRLTEVEEAIKRFPIEAQIWYANANVWERSNPYISGMVAYLGLNAQEEEQLWELAFLQV